MRYTAFVEGWALYCENLGDYTDNELFGKYMEEKLRAIRLVIDTGIHAFGWDKQKTKQFFVSNSLLPEEKIDIQIDRYIANPGQALGYKLGELFFNKYKEKWIQSGLDIKDYHSLILDNGVIPFKILEKKIKKVLEK